MIKLMLSEIAAAVGGRSRTEVPASSALGVSTDTRTLQRGEVFFAISGPNFDGHDFVPAALEKGAIAAVVAANRAEGVRGAMLERKIASHAPLIEVDDVVTALGRLASYHRAQTAAVVIAVVGSNGKTTTKAMIDHVLSGQKRGRSSPKSFNNNIGVPLTLLSVEAADDYVVVEIGTNAAGEIAQLGKMARPDMVVLTSIGEEHLEGLGDLAGVAREECAIFHTLAEGGFVAVNIDAPHVADHLPTRRTTIVRFGHRSEADLRISDVSFAEGWLSFRLNGRFHYRLRMPGAHNALNAAGAIAVARRMGFEHPAIAERLESFSPPPMRSAAKQIAGVTWINDAYNANPASVRAAIDMLEQYPTSGRKIIALGEMRELGARSAGEHRQIAERLARSRLDHVLLVGGAADWMIDAFDARRVAERVTDPHECGRRLAELTREGDVVLLKASRAVGLERAMEFLETTVQKKRERCDVK